MALRGGELVPAPKGLSLHPMEPGDHDKYVKTLGTLTADNQAEVTKQLRKLVPE